MKKKRFIIISILCMLFVALSLDIAIKKASYAKNEINLSNGTTYDFILEYAGNAEMLDNYDYKHVNDNSLKLKNDIERNYTDTSKNDLKSSKSILIKKMIITSTFTLKAFFLYYDIYLKEKIKSKHDDGCTYKVISNAYGIKETKKE